MNTRQRAGVLRKLLHELAARPQGATTAEASGHGYTPVEFAGGFLNEVKGKRLFSVKLGSKSSTYFTSREIADARKKAYDKPVVLAGTTGVITSRSRAPWPKDAETVYPTNADGTPAYRHTICPPTQAGRTTRTTTHPQ